MIRLRYLSLLLLVLFGCARLPEIRPSDSNAARLASACAEVFPQGTRQFLHAIEATPPGGKKQTLLGLIRMSSDRGSVDCALMTLEGLVLFEARYDRKIVVERAVPPLDAEGFAEGLMNDVRMLFFAPASPPEATGFSETGDIVCRYRDPERGTEDIVVRPGGGWEIRRYDSLSRLSRSARSEGGTLVLRAYGIAGYRLAFTLVEAFPIE